ncbi:FAD-dependent oxidoreductase [Kibdelosporangium lantanae]
MFAAGGCCDRFFVVLSGKAGVLDDERVMRVHGHHRFLGELGLPAGQSCPVSAVMVLPGEVLEVSNEALKQLVADDPVLGDLILRAYLVRRSLLVRQGAGFRVIGSRYAPDARRLREFAARNRLPHRWTDVERDQRAETLLRWFDIRPRDTPVVIWDGRTVLRNPGNAELARLAGLVAPGTATDIHDLLVVGAGPAGLAAAAHAAAAGLSTVVVDGLGTGGQAARSPLVEDYLGFPAGISGAELAERAALQAEKFGACHDVPAEVVGLVPDNGHYVVRYADGTETHSRSVLIATGVRYRTLDVPRLERFEGTGVYYAATVLEAQQYGSEPVAIVGGGDTAGQAALFLARFAPRVYLVVRDGGLGKSMSRYLVDQLDHTPNVEVLPHTEVRDLVGAAALEGVVVADRTGKRRSIEVRALFVFIGAEPRTSWLAGTVAMTAAGFVLTGHDAMDNASGAVWSPVNRPPMPLETTWPGVFAAGDVRHGSTRRVASAFGEGAMAVRLVHEHLSPRR